MKTVWKACLVAAVSASALRCAADEFKDYRLAIVEESRDMAAFENPAFEDVSKYGTVDENAEIANRMATKMLRKVQRKVGFAERGRR